MNSFSKIILILVACVNIISCTPSAPYEIKSPCVSIDSPDHSYGITPCARRPVNLEYAIS